MSLKERSSSFGVRFHVVLVAQIEREDEVPLLVLARDHVLDADIETVRLVGVWARLTHDLLDARLVLVDRLFAVKLRARGGHVVVGREHEVVDPAAEVLAVDPLARRGPEHDEDRLADVLLERRARHPTVEVDRDREPEPLAEKFAIVGHVR